MMKRKSLYVILGLMAVVLSGCGKEEVVYNTETLSDSSEFAATEISTEATGNENSLISQLGITDSYKWKETVATGGTPANVSAEIYLYYNTDLVAINAEEHYYSKEEKQNVLNYFFDPDSIQADRDTYPTKEWLQAKLQEYETVLDAKKKDEYNHVTDSEAMMVSDEISYLTDCINTAPNKDEVSEEVTDYSENYYKGKRNNLDYSLTFDINEENNRSAWKMQVKDYNDVLTNQNEVLAWQYGGYTEEPNQCNMTEEQAKEIADKACQDLGLVGLTLSFDTCDVIWHMENGEQECNGYYFEYGLDMNGESFYFSRTERYGGYINSVSADKTYDNQKVTIIVNDSGIVRMECTGIMKYGKANQVKLLSYEQIKECFRNVLRESNTTKGKWQNLYLYYMRLTNKDNPDMYSYVPVWSLSNYEAVEDIVINAIDGTRIDLEDNGYILYDPLENWLQEHYNMTVLENAGYPMARFE